MEEECPICYESYGENNGFFLCKDGKHNSNFAEDCAHYICVICCYKLRKQDEIKCPLCREDWTDWIHSHYSDSDDDDE